MKLNTYTLTLRGNYRFVSPLDVLTSFNSLDLDAASPHLSTRGTKHSYGEVIDALKAYLKANKWTSKQRDDQGFIEGYGAQTSTKVIIEAEDLNKPMQELIETYKGLLKELTFGHVDFVVDYTASIVHEGLVVLRADICYMKRAVV